VPDTGAPRPPPPQLWRPGPLSQGDLLISVFFVAMLVASSLLEPSNTALTVFGYELPTTCLFRGLTGWRCPGCGLTRAFTFMGHLQPVEAFRVHVLGPPMYVGAVIYTILRLRDLYRAVKANLDARR
jgi:hypothetical protein